MVFWTNQCRHRHVKEPRESRGFRLLAILSNHARRLQATYRPRLHACCIIPPIVDLALSPDLRDGRLQAPDGFDRASPCRCLPAFRTERTYQYCVYAAWTAAMHKDRPGDDDR